MKKMECNSIEQRDEKGTTSLGWRGLKKLFGN